MNSIHCVPNSLSMKTVTGEIISSNPVSVSKATSILSKFVSAETGASQAVNAYLRRATAAFDELVRLHSKSDCRRHKGDQSNATAARITDASELTSSKSCEVETKADKKKKKKKEKRKNEGDYGNEVKMEDIREADKIVAETQTNKEQKRKDKEVNGSFVNYGDDEGKLKEESERKEKKNKKKREKGNVGYSEENGGEVGEEAEIEEDKGERRKNRKNRDVEEIGDGSQSKKKKTVKLMIRPCSNSSLYHFSMFHASHHILPVPATEEEIEAEATAVKAVAEGICPLKIVLDRVVLTLTGVLMGCWQVISGTDPLSIRVKLRAALPHAPEKQLYDAAILHTSFARLLGPPKAASMEQSNQLQFFQELVSRLNDKIRGFEASVSELWYVEEYDVLALALDGRLNVRRFQLGCNRA